MAGYIINVFNMFLKPLHLIYCGQHCKLIYDVFDAYFSNSSGMFFSLNYHKTWLNIPKCPQCLMIMCTIEYF